MNRIIAMTLDGAGLSTAGNGDAAVATWFRDLLVQWTGPVGPLKEAAE